MQYLDNISHEIGLTINQGNKRNQTILGGILTLIYIAVITAMSIVFTYDFFALDKPQLSSTKGFNEYMKIPIDKVPILFRLSDSISKPYDNPETIYKIYFQVWYQKTNTHSADLTYQDYDNIPMERCDINKHFGDYKYLFENYTDINTFFCPVHRLSNQSLLGAYGNSKPYTYYHVQIAYCTNTTKTANETKCASNDDIKANLELSYLDIRTVDYLITNNETIPRKLYIRSTRNPVTINMHKRTWMYYDLIDYHTDNGFMMKIYKQIQFYQISNIVTEIYLRDINKIWDHVYGSFASVTFTNTNLNITYYRSYQKLQDLLANIGGIIKSAVVIALIVNYIPSTRSYYLTLINSMISSETLKKTQKKTNFHSYIVMNQGSQLPICLNKSSSNVLEKQLQNNSPKNIQKENVHSKIKASFMFYSLPFKCQRNKDLIQIYIKEKTRIDNLLDVTNVLKVMTRVDEMQKLLLMQKPITIKESFISDNIIKKYKYQDNELIFP